MRSSTKRILQRGNFRDLDDPEKSVVLVKGIVKDLIIDAGRNIRLDRTEAQNLCTVLTQCWWCSWWALSILMKETVALDIVRRYNKGNKRREPREHFEDVIDKLILQQELLGGRDLIDWSKAVKP